MNEVWPDAIVEESNLTHNVSALRKALGEKPGEHRFIVIIPGQGYRFVAGLSETDNGAEEILFERTRSRFVFEQDNPDEQIGSHSEVVNAGESSAFENAHDGVGLRPGLLTREQAGVAQALKRRGIVIVLSLVCLLAAGGLVYRVNNQSRARGTSGASSGASQMTIKRLTTHGISVNATLSPDGKLFVYSTSKEGRQSLWLGHVDGSEPLMLRPPSEASYRGLAFAPDGKMIACEYLLNPNSPPKLAIISIEGGRLLKVFDVPRTAIFRYGIRWMPDGNAVAYRDAADGIWKQSLDSTEPKRLEGLPQERLYSYSWSPDGKQFAFTRGSTIRDVVLIKNFK